MAAAAARPTWWPARAGVRPVEVQTSAVERRLRYEVELDRGDDAAGALTAPEREEQLSVVGGRDASQDPVTGDHLEGADPVRGETVGAGHRPEPTASRVAHDADVGGRAAERRETVRRCGLDDAAPLHAGPDTGPPVGGHHAFVETGRRHDDLTDEPGDRAVTGRLRGHGQLMARSETDRFDDVLGALRTDDGGRPDGHRDVPRRDERVIAG